MQNSMVLIVFIILNAVELIVNALFSQMAFWMKICIHLSWMLGFIYYIFSIISVDGGIPVFKVSFLEIIGAVFLGGAIYVLNVMYNTIMINRMIVFDWRLYFRIPSDITVTFMAVLFAVLEEFTYRYWVVAQMNNVLGILILTSLAYGVNHSIFNDDEAFVKSLFGMLLGASLVITHSVWVPVMMHVTFNCLSSNINKKSSRSDGE